MKKYLLLLITLSSLSLGSLAFANNNVELDKEKVLKEIEMTGKYERFRLEDLSENLKNDRDVVFAAVMKNPENLRFAVDGFRNDIKLVLAAVIAKRKSVNLFSEDKPDVNDVLKHMGSKIRNNKVSILRLMDEEPTAIKYAGTDLKNDKGFILKAIKKNPIALGFANKKLLMDKELVLAAVNIDGLALKYADATLKKDKDVVLAAIKNDPSSLRYADFSLKTDIEFRKIQKEQINNNMKPNKKTWN